MHVYFLFCHVTQVGKEVSTSLQFKCVEVIWKLVSVTRLRVKKK